MKIFFDGGCRPNPGRMEAAVVAAGKFRHWPDLGFGSSEEAEWRALLLAVELARSVGAAEIELLGDSRSVIDRARGRTRASEPRFQPLLEAFLQESAGIARLRLKHVRRGQNLAGIFLARRRNGAGGATS